MDGLKKRLSESVQYRLSFSLSAAVIAVALAAGIVSFLSAFDQAQELQDDVLAQIAALMDQSTPTLKLPAGGLRLKDSDNDSLVYIQALGGAAPVATGNGPDTKMPALAATLKDGLHTLESADGAYRVLVRTTHTGSRIAFAQETGARDEVAYNSALNTVLPLLILIPVLLIGIAQLIRKMFRPITVLSRQIDTRTESDLQPVRDEHIPSEVRPFVLAINRLLARVSESVNVQQRFVADAAHELRSPLTALSLQAQRLEHLQMSDAARDRLHILEKGIDRGRSLLNQLLNLSRAQASIDLPTQAVSMLGVYRTVLEALMPLAKAKRIDLGVLDGPDATVWTSEQQLSMMVRNLVDNAVRYSPPGGRVDLSVETNPQHVTIRVADTGPGVPPEERARIFEPFYRILGTEQLGSGLGLAIVGTIARRLGAVIRLDATDSDTGSGLTVSITLPARVQRPA